MENFDFHRPGNLADAVSTLKGTEEGKYLGGGQSLLPVMKLDMAMPSDLVSLANIAELKGISASGGTLRIGAGCTHAEVASNATVKATIGALAELAHGAEIGGHHRQPGTHGLKYR